MVFSEAEANPVARFQVSPSFPPYKETDFEVIFYGNHVYHEHQ